MIRKNIPNFITCLNLFSGCFAIVMAFRGNLILSAWFIGLAAIFDFLDVMIARVLRVKSDLGVQLDSLADIISFGLAPAVIIFQMIENSNNLPLIYFIDINILSFSAFLIPVFSAVRLAKFNIDERQTDSFTGLPTPASALFLASLPLVVYQSEKMSYPFIINILENAWVLAAISIAFSVLMVSSIKLFSLKFKNFSWTENRLRYVFLIIAVALFLILKFIAIPLIIVLYILISLIGRKI